MQCFGHPSTSLSGILLFVRTQYSRKDQNIKKYQHSIDLSLSDNYQADVVEAFNSTSRYLDDLLNFDNHYFAQMVSQIYPNELQLNKTIHSDAEAPCLDLDLSITNGIVSTKMYVKGDNFIFDIVHFSFLDGGVPRSNSSVYTIHNLFVLQDNVLILMTSTISK